MQHGEFSEKPGEWRQAGEQDGAGTEAEAKHGHGTGHGDAALFFGLVLVDIAIGFHRHGQNVGAGVTGAFHQFDQQEEGTHRQCRTDEIKQRAADDGTIAKPDRRHQRAG